MSHEFDLIEQFFKPLSFTQANEIGIGDDGAVLNCPAGHQLVVVTDTLVSGVHFPESTSSYDIAWKSLAVNLSDLAAMGAKPGFFSLALTLPDDLNSVDWLANFSKGLKDLASQTKLPLIGGDTTCGPLSVTVTAQGWIESGKALQRSGAQVGDDIYLSGSLGEGGLGLANVLQGLKQADFGFSEIAQAKLNRPQPRVALGRALIEQSISTCAIDVSDGLLADLAHILKASNLGATLFSEQLPLSQNVKAWQEKHQLPLFALTAGDDYELCFTASHEKRDVIASLATKLSLQIQRIGEVKPLKRGAALEPIELLDAQNQKMQINPGGLGYQHF